MTLMMTTTQVVETSVATKNSHFRTKPTQTINQLQPQTFRIPYTKDVEMPTSKSLFVTQRIIIIISFYVLQTCLVCQCCICQQQKIDSRMPEACVSSLCTPQEAMILWTAAASRWLLTASTGSLNATNKASCETKKNDETWSTPIQ